MDGDFSEHQQKPYFMGFLHYRANHRIYKTVSKII